MLVCVYMKEYMVYVVVIKGLNDKYFPLRICKNWKDTRKFYKYGNDFKVVKIKYVTGITSFDIYYRISQQLNKRTNNIF